MLWGTKSSGVCPWSSGREMVLFLVCLFICCLLFPAPGQNPNCWLGPPEPRRADRSASRLSAGQRGHGALAAEMPCQLLRCGDAGLPHPHSTEVLPEGVRNCWGCQNGALPPVWGPGCLLRVVQNWTPFRAVLSRNMSCAVLCCLAEFSKEQRSAAVEKKKKSEKKSFSLNLYII